MRLILTVGLCCWALTANANVLDETDWRRMGDLLLKAINLSEDVWNTGKGARGDASNCLFFLFTGVNEIRADLEHLAVMTKVGSMMIDKRDEQTVLGALNMKATNFIEKAENIRTNVNMWVGMCSKYNVVAIKGQEILRLNDEASSTVRSMLKRLGGPIISDTR
jgi:hypothetical protein